MTSVMTYSAAIKNQSLENTPGFPEAAGASGFSAGISGEA